MGKPELGQKMTCADCAARFYDLNRSPILCPKCGVEQRPARQGSPYPGRASTRRWLPRSATFTHVEPLSANAATADAGDDLDSADPPDDDDDAADDDAAGADDEAAGADEAGDDTAGDKAAEEI